jgi:hypothetical protein
MDRVKDVTGNRFANVPSMCNPSQVNGFFEVFTIR